MSNTIRVISAAVSHTGAVFYTEDGNERTISITNNMPFLRTSVDHGTALDIAGTGKVSEVSMVEAIKLAAQYAPNFNKH